MANIQILCRNYTGTYAFINGVRNQDISQYTILRAIITLGFQNRIDLLHRIGWRGFFHRFGTGISALSCLEQNQNDLCLSDSFNNLDMSEKASLSYWFGMAFAKIVAESQLSIPWLCHVDHLRYKKILNITNGSNERGDFAGIDKYNNWHVIEAKGRSNPYPDGLVTKAKGQASRVTAINNLPPSTTSACIASIHCKPISVLLDDPNSKENKGFENKEVWKISDNSFFNEYYRKIIGHLREFNSNSEGNSGNDHFIKAPLYPLYQSRHDMLMPFDHLEIGLLKSIYDDPEKAFDAVKDINQINNKKTGSDGIAIFGTIPDFKDDKL